MFTTTTVVTKTKLKVSMSAVCFSHSTKTIRVGAQKIRKQVRIPFHVTEDLLQMCKECYPGIAVRSAFHYHQGLNCVLQNSPKVLRCIQVR